jgi:hypothetical protein
VRADETQTQATTEAHFTEPHIAGPHRITRVIRVPMQRPDKITEKALRVCAAHAADYANACLMEWWVKKKWQLSNPQSLYQQFGDYLSSYARDAINDRVKGVIRRNGTLMLRGEVQLSAFLRNSALSLRADEDHRGAKLLAGAQRIAIRPSKEWLEVEVYGPALKKDWYLRETLRKIAAGEYALTRCGVNWRRDGKLFFHLTYSRDGEALSPSDVQAELIYNETGELWIQSGTRRLNLTDRVYRLVHMKQHFSGIQSRLRRCLGRSGDRQRLRRALLKRQTYEEWSDGPIGQLSAEAIQFCVKNGAGVLVCTLPRDGVIAWRRLMDRLNCAAEAAGIVCTAGEAGKPLMTDWERIAEMLKAQQQLLRLGPPYGILDTSSPLRKIGTSAELARKGGAHGE